MYCFGDFEFTCGKEISFRETELLSAGLVICDEQFNLVETYYRTAKPHLFPKLTGFCKDLTHLTQKEIDDSAESTQLYADMNALLDKYKINKVFVMGNFDVRAIHSDYLWYRLNNVDTNGNNGRKFSKKICDIEYEINDVTKLRNAVGIRKLLYIYDIPEGEDRHNALNDARYLYEICKKMYEMKGKTTPVLDKLREDDAKALAEIASYRAKKKELREQRSAEKQQKMKLSIEQDFINKYTEIFGEEVDMIYHLVKNSLKKSMKGCKSNLYVAEYSDNPYNISIHAIKHIKDRDNIKTKNCLSGVFNKTQTVRIVNKITLHILKVKHTPTK